MIEKILAAPKSYPAHLHRHLLQLYVIRHRREPASEREQRRAVFEYLTRGQKDRTGRVHIHANAALAAWLTADDENVRGWGRVPRLSALVYQFSGDLRKRYDLGAERDYKEFACYVALTLQSLLRWPEEIVAPALREVLWEKAPGIRSRSRIGVTRAMNHVRRNAERVRDLDLSDSESLTQLLLALFSDMEAGKLPGYVLSPEQLDYLTTPVESKRPGLRLSGLLHHLLVERGHVRERELLQSEVAANVRRELPGMLARLRLPAVIREAHAEYLARILPVTPEETFDPIVTVVGPVGHGSGLGAAARACLESLRSARIPVEVLRMKTATGRTDENAATATTTRIRGDVNVIHFNPDVIIENLSLYGLDQFEGRYNIGFFFWETTQASFAHRLGADLVDEIWVSSEYCREVFQRVTDKPVILVGTPVPKIGSVAWASRGSFDLDPRAFTFLYTFDGASRLTRKNPLAAVEAFQRAFPTQDDVRLVLKTQNTNRLAPVDDRLYAQIRNRVRQDRRITVIDETFTSNEVHGLISVSDCYMSLHRSEGFGYGMAEAMKLRVPVIATGYSGNADFTSEETAYPVRWSLVPVSARDFVYDEAGQEWAEPDMEHAAQRMIEVKGDSRRGKRVQRAYDQIQKLYGEATVGQAYRERIEAIRAGLAVGWNALEA